MPDVITIGDVRIAFGHLLSAALDAGVIAEAGDLRLVEGPRASFRLARRAADGEWDDALGLPGGQLGSTRKEAHAALRMLRLGIRAVLARDPAKA